MDHFAGLDVSVKETSICIVDDTGKIVREVKVTSEPDALLAVLIDPAYRFKRIGLEAGPLAQWLFSGLAPGEVFTGRKPDLCEAHLPQRVQGNASARAVEALPWMLSKVFLNDIGLTPR
jgi:hypothetical protein